jgi:hypothetical protein
MKKVMFFVFAASLFVLAGCSSNNSPSAIESEMLTQMKNGNYEKAVELYFKYTNNAKEDTSAEEMAEYTKAFAQKAKESAEKQGGLKSFEIVSETISEDGTEAEVVSKLVYGDGSDKEETSKYVKVNEQWKIKSGK